MVEVLMLSRCSSIPEVSAAMSQHTGGLVEGADTYMQAIDRAVAPTPAGPALAGPVFCST